jgi:hypothetical protein
MKELISVKDIYMKVYFSVLLSWNIKMYATEKRHSEFFNVLKESKF